VTDEQKKKETIASRTLEPGVLEPHDTIVDPPLAEEALTEEQRRAQRVARAKLLWGKDDDEEMDDAEAERLLASIDRSIARRRAGPQRIAAHSDGGSNVAYSGTAVPVAALWQRAPTTKVKIAPDPADKPVGARNPGSADREVPTVVVGRVRAKTRANLATAAMALVGVVGLGAAAWLWAGGTSVPERAGVAKAANSSAGAEAQPLASRTPSEAVAASSAAISPASIGGTGSSAGVEAAAPPQGDAHANAAGHVSPPANAGRRAVSRPDGSASHRVGGAAPTNAAVSPRGPAAASSGTKTTGDVDRDNRLMEEP